PGRPARPDRRRRRLGGRRRPPPRGRGLLRRRGRGGLSPRTVPASGGAPRGGPGRPRPGHAPHRGDLTCPRVRTRRTGVDRSIVTASPADGSSDAFLLAGRYAVGEPIGRGRSTVHRGEDTRLQRPVAMKEVRLAETQEGVERARVRALREARAAARLDNPSVVTVYDVVEEGGSIWLVMELVKSPSLAQIVADGGPLDHGRAARIGLGVLGALESAHAVGI